MCVREKMLYTYNNSSNFLFFYQCETSTKCKLNNYKIKNWIHHTKKKKKKEYSRI